MVTVTMSTTVDFGPMLMSLARRAKVAAGEAPPSENELSETRAQVAQALEASRAAQAETVGAQLRKSLPKGISLKSLDADLNGLIVTSHTTLELEALSLMPHVVLASGEGEPLRPFADFTVKHEGGTVVLTGKAPALPEGAGTLTLKLTGEGAPVSHNANSEEQGTLTWQGSGFDVRVAYKA